MYSFKFLLGTYKWNSKHAVLNDEKSAYSMLK